MISVERCDSSPASRLRNVVDFHERMANQLDVTGADP